MPNTPNTTLPEVLHKAGYDAEEEYFHKLNHDLIEANRKRLDDQRRKLEAKEREKAHWMKCPKCGNSLTEQITMGLKGDVCSGCSGVFFDHAELEQLMGTHEAQPFKEAMRKMMKEALKPRPTGLGSFPV